ncbi:cytochrome P450 [Streptomyces armeniacus]|uniref:Cytochrome P450 n=1 Tax=Streptomyces armeniacus TaxID=83291 RepID=A0A345XTU4_9ACTN|nr:cytochrome P450 [Streptomyces armeniacus]AXK35060.1 cytochrome P450 [Streptomyces armeniacus]
MNQDSAHHGPPPSCPAHGRIGLYTSEFGADPDGHYAALRQYGSSAPVEMAPGVEAELVTGYAAALHILQNPATFVRDSRRWRALAEGRVPEDSPALAMMAYRPNALFSDGLEHSRLRQVVTDTLATVDPHELDRHVQQVATYLIDQFCGGSETDLLVDYAMQLPLLVYSELFGCTADIGDRVIYGISGIFAGGADAEHANKVLGEALYELVKLKRRSPGRDITSRMLQHGAGLSDDEMVNQLVTLLSGGTAPLASLISTGTALLLGDDRYAGTHFLVEEAIQEVLWRHAPIANYAVHYPVQDVEVDGRVLRADEPVVISFAAANTDPAVVGNSSHHLRGRSHLAFGAGPHVCPAKDPAILIGRTAIEALLTRLTDVELAVGMRQLSWQPTPWGKTLTALPVRFTPVPRSPKRSSEMPAAAPAATPAAQAPAAQPARGGKRWTSFLNWLKGV